MNIPSVSTEGSQVPRTRARSPRLLHRRHYFFERAHYRRLLLRRHLREQRQREALAANALGDGEVALAVAQAAWIGVWISQHGRVVSTTPLTSPTKPEPA